MNYTGKLYGKIGRTYIPMILTSEDADRMESELSELRLHRDRLAASVRAVLEEVGNDYMACKDELRESLAAVTP